MVGQSPDHLRATGQLTRSYSYDAAGNTTSDGTRTFTYNDAGRMETSTKAGVTTTYSYNGLGERVKKTSSAATTYFAYDEAGHLIGEYDAAGDPIQETVWLGDIPVATLKPTVGGGVSVFYVHTDHLNTPRRITRPSDNAIVWRWDSDPFGATAANDDADGDTITFAYHLRFPGQYFDAETGLHYNYFRDYDPGTGRYLQSDPAAAEASAKAAAEAAAKTIPRPAAGEDLFVGPYGQTKRANIQSGLNATHTPHHVVQHAVSSRSNWLGVTINVRKDLHELTRTYGVNADLGSNVRNLAADVRDLRNILRSAGYDRALVNQQMRRLIELNRQVGNVP